MWPISKHSKGAETIGLYAARDEAVAIHAAPSSTGLSVLTDIFHLGQQDQTFKEAVTRAHLRGRRANGVLAMGEYQLLMVDAPDVPAEELRSAVKWKIRDLINFHIDDVVIDVFDVPTRGTVSSVRSLYVVAARVDAVQGLVDRLFVAGLEIGAIDIVEMALRNLAYAAAGEREGLVTLYLEPDRGVIVFSRGGTLHFTRQLDLGFSQLDDPEVNSRLVLEIQRSLDYCDSHLDFGRPSRITVVPFQDTGPAFVEGISIDIGLPTEYFKFTQFVDGPALANGMAAPDWIALGAALRVEERKL